MISLSSVVGNIIRDKKLHQEYLELCQQGKCEKIILSRLEMQRSRIRKTTDKGTDVGLVFEPDVRLRNGDVVYKTNDRIIVLELEPEKVAVLTFSRGDATDDEAFKVAVEIGHAIGNLHRPIMINEEKIFVPIQAESELELLRKIFTPIIDHVTITRKRMAFEAEEGMHTHEH